MTRPTITPELLAIAAAGLLHRPPAGERPRDWQELEADWRRWLAGIFPRSIGKGIFAPYHEEFWEWVWALERGVRPQPFIGIWPRGWAKSTSAELACCVLGAMGKRVYALYVSRGQEQANKHVADIGALLESPNVEAYYPDLATRLVSKYGHSRGWRGNRLRCRSGFTIDAFGLDVEMRGTKVIEDRPDLIILDDIDGPLDTLKTVQDNITKITKSVLPAGSPDMAVLAIQNVILGEGVFARLADGRADFLADRIVSGPYPALDHAAYHQGEDGRWRLVAGEPTWAVMGLQECQAIIDSDGLTSFRAERQQEVTEPPGGMYDHLDFRHASWEELPDLVRIVVWVDPAVTDTDDSDAHGIQADGLGPDGTIYRLWSWEDRTSPTDALQRAIRIAVRLGAEAVGVETDQGGDTWQPTYREAARELLLGEEMRAEQIPPFRAAKAGAGHGSKVHRSSQMLADYERGQIVHVVGTHDALERSLRRFPKSKPLDLADAAYWAWYDLRVGVEEREEVVELGPEFAAAGRSAWDRW